MMLMNLVDDAKAKVEEQKKQLEEVGRKEIELAEQQQILKDQMEAAVDMNDGNEKDTNRNNDYSLGGSILK